MITSIPATIRLHPVELLACWRALGFGETPTQLWIRPPGETVEDSERLLARALVELAGRGLSDTYQPHPTLAGMLRVIAESEYLVDIRLSDTRDSSVPILGLGAVAGADGVTLITYDGVEGLLAPIELAAMDSTRVTATLLGLAAAYGPMRPGIGAATNIPANALDTAILRSGGADLWAIADRLCEQGIPSRDAYSIARMCSGAGLTAALGITARTGRFHQEQRGGWVVGFHVGDHGWFSQLRRAGYVTIEPTDLPRLHRRWHELIVSIYS